MTQKDGKEGEGETRVDIALVGGGLANGLIAHRLRATRPDVAVALFEAGETPGGNHTWSFHDGDLTAGQHLWLEPFVAHRWPFYDVRFPGRSRHIATGYASVTSERFAARLHASLGAAIRCRAPVASFDASSVTLADGRRIAAGAVIDGRGAAPSPRLALRFQKFLGREIELDRPHGLAGPLVMDATVDQDDGYRFVYLLPFGPCRLLVEDTYYADGSALDPAALRRRIDAYLAVRGWRAARVLREEEGVLPIALGGDVEGFWRDKRGIAAAGLAAALFHPTTGYSLPDAVRLAERIAGLADLSGPSLFAATRDHAVAAWRGRGFFRLLNRLLFGAGLPSERYRILEHFHRLPGDLIARFYAGRLTPFDKLRVLAGRPPVPLAGALRVLASVPFRPGTAA